MSFRVSVRVDGDPGAETIDCLGCAVTESRNSLELSPFQCYPKAWGPQKSERCDVDYFSAALARHRIPAGLLLVPRGTAKIPHFIRSLSDPPRERADSVFVFSQNLPRQSWQWPSGSGERGGLWGRFGWALAGWGVRKARRLTWLPRPLFRLLPRMWFRSRLRVPARSLDGLPISIRLRWREFQCCCAIAPRAPRRMQSRPETEHFAWHRSMRANTRWKPMNRISATGNLRAFW